MCLGFLSPLFEISCILISFSFIVLPTNRSEDGKDDKLSSSIDQRSSDSVLSMKHLIAAAQAKKKQAHLQNFSDNPNFLLALNTDEPVRTPSPAPVAQPMGSSSMAPSDVQGFLPKSSMISPPSDVYHASSTNQHDTDEFVVGISSGHRTAGGSLSGGTEAAVSRDAFEGMIETLSRTKDSIGRATRLAIDCAKYGLANEVGVTYDLNCLSWGFLWHLYLFPEDRQNYIFHFRFWYS